MKKLSIIFVALLCCISIVIFAACNPNDEEQTYGVDFIMEKYEATASATRIEQTIEIEKGEDLVRSLKKTLTRTETGYDVTETEKKLSEVSVGNVPDSRYTETTNNYSLKAAAEGTATLDLKQEYFNPIGFSVTETTLKGVLKDSDVKKFLNMEDELPAEIKGLNVEITVSETAVTSIKMSYSSEGYLVNITLNYTY